MCPCHVFEWLSTDITEGRRDCNGKDKFTRLYSWLVGLYFPPAGVTEKFSMNLHCPTWNFLTRGKKTLLQVQLILTPYINIRYNKIKTIEHNLFETWILTNRHTHCPICEYELKRVSTSVIIWLWPWMKNFDFNDPSCFKWFNILQQTYSTWCNHSHLSLFFFFSLEI